MSFWAIAPSTPTTIVRPAMMSMNVTGPSLGNSSVCVRTMAYTPILVRSPANKAVTGVGATGYESGSQKKSGKMAALMPNTRKSIQPRPLRRPAGTSSRRAVRSAMLTVPVVA